MKIQFGLTLSALIFAATPATLMAEDYEFHPVLSDTFSASLGYMRSSNSFKFSAEVLGVPDSIKDEIDFGDSIGVSDSSTFFNGQLKWKFGSTKKWSLAGQYFSNKANGNSTLTEDISWEDVTFEDGSYVEGGVKLSVTRLFLGYSLVKKPQHDFGIGAGIHNLDLDAYIEGEIRVNGETTGTRKVSNGASQILPNLGTWYNYSPARNWLLHARLDWIGASIGEYDGSLWNSSAGVSYQAWRNVGFDLSWQYFKLDVNVENPDWIGGAKMTYSGPVFSVIFSW